MRIVAGRCSVPLINRKGQVLDEEDLLAQIGFTDRELFTQKFKEITGISFEEYCVSLTNQDEI